MALHGLAATIWVGGMFFAYVILRPASSALEPGLRLTLWAGVFQRFFLWVWLAIVVLLGTGYWLVFNAFGGFSASPFYVHLMHIGGLIMVLLFFYLYFRPRIKFNKHVKSQAWPEAASAMNAMRQIVLANLILGCLLITVVYAGRYG